MSKRRLLSIILIAVFLISLLPVALPVTKAMALDETPTLWVDGTLGDDTTGDGTEANPYRTIQKASDMTVPGDTVMIKPGTYFERIIITKTGTPEAPITYKATERQGVIISANGQANTLVEAQDFKDEPNSSDVRNIHFKGIVFADSDTNASVKAAIGWCFEDCVFRNGGGLLARGGETYVTRCIFEDTNENGLTAAFGHFEFKDCIIRRANQSAYSPGGFAGANKVLVSDGLVVDGLISYDNYGAGWWMDWDNIDFTIKNCTIFGNHAGEAYELVNGNMEVVHHAWAAPGIWSEGNPGPGLIENNVIHSNDAEGIGLLESGFRKEIIVRNNLIINNSGGGISIRGLERGDHKAGPAIITGNKFKNSYSQVLTAGYDWSTDGGHFKTITSATPADMGFEIDYNTYDNSIALEAAEYYEVDVWPMIGWASYNSSNNPAITRVTANTIDDMRAEPLQIEEHGSVAPVNDIPDNQLIDVYPLESITDVGNPGKMHQVPSQAAEDNTIDEALENVSEGDEVSIPVYGRLRDIEQHGNVYVMDVYDLQARHVRVAMDEETKDSLTQAIQPYVVLMPYNLTMKLSEKSEDGYTIEGIDIGLDSITEVPDPIVDEEAPSAPTNLRMVGEPTTNSVTLAWDASTDNTAVTGYDIYRGATKVNAYNLTGTTFKVEGLSADTLYTFTVVAKDAAKNKSSASSGLQVKTARAAVTGDFVLGVNCGGNAVVIDGNSWLSWSDALSHGGVTVVQNAGGYFSNSANNINPEWTPQFANYDYFHMMDTALSGNNKDIKLKQTINNGNYNVYLWTFENWQNDSRFYKVNLEGEEASAAIGTLPFGTWKKYGPFNVTVNDGVLDLDIINQAGDPMLAGYAIFEASPAPTTGPSAPSDLTVTGKAANSISISWASNDENAVGYDVYSGTEKVNDDLVTGTNYTFDGLDEGVTYVFRVKSVDGDSLESVFSEPVSMMTLDETPPAAPDNFRETAKNMRSISLGWDAATDNVSVAGYNLYSGATKINGSLIIDTSFTLPDLESNTSYSYTVTSVDTSGNESVNSDEITVTTDRAPVSTRFVKGVNLGGNAVTIEGNGWISHADALAHGLTVVEGGTWAGDQHLTFSPALPDSDYDHMLNSLVFGGNGNIRLTQAIEDGHYNVYLWTIENWDPNSRVYNVNLEGTYTGKIGTLPVGGWKKYGPFYTEVTDGVMNIDIWRQQAEPMLFGMAIYEAEAEPAEGPFIPTDLVVTQKTSSSVSLSWTDSDNSNVTYDVYRGSTKVNDLPITGTSYTVTNLSPLTTYAFTVRAKTQDGVESFASEPVSVRTLEFTLTSTGKTANSVSLSWAMPDIGVPVAGYDVYRGSTKVNDSDIAENSYTVDGLAAYTNYTFTVKAKDAGGNVLDTSSALTVRTDHAFTIGALQLKNASGEDIPNQLPEQGLVSVTAPVTNVSDEASLVILIVALYNNSGDIVNLSYVTKSIGAGDEEALTAGFNIPRSHSGYQMKVMVWDGLLTMHSLTEPVTIQ